MACIGSLPSDVLGDIFITAFASDLSIVDMMIPGQVCRHWRNVALYTPLLWSRILLVSTRDFMKFKTVLSRTGTCSALEISIPGNHASTHEARINAALSTLIPHAHRIRSLSMLLANHPFLLSGIIFPHLHTLSLNACASFCKLTMPADIRLTAPALRVLHITNTRVPNLEVLLSTRLVDINISSFILCSDEIAPILATCHGLERLTFRRHMCETPTLSIVVPPVCMPGLRELNLQLPHDDLASILRAFPAIGNVSSVAVHINERRVTLAPRFFEALLAGLRPVVALSVEHGGVLELRDDAGRKRTLFPAPRAGLPRVWSHLSSRYGAHASVRDFQIPLADWNHFAAALRACPSEAGAGVRLRVVPGSDDLRNDYAHLDTLAIRGLSQVVFPWDALGYTSLDVLARALHSILFDGGRQLDVEFLGHLGAASMERFESAGGGKWRVVRP